MDAKALLRSVMARKNIKPGKVSDALGYESRQTFANLMQYNRMTMRKFAEVADVLGCDVVLQDRETGEIYR